MPLTLLARFLRCRSASGPHAQEVHSGYGSPSSLNSPFALTSTFERLLDAELSGS
jgi:hypothetical protein